MDETQPAAGSGAGITGIAAGGALAACGAVALALRATGLELQSLWLDEFLAFQIGQQDLPGIWGTAAAIPGQSPFYYLVVRGWTELFGRDSVLVIRSLSVLLGLVSLAQTGFFVRRWLGTDRALLTLFLLAVSPAHLYFSQEARMYPLLAVLLLGALQLAVAAVRDPGARGSGRIAAHGLLVCLALYTHYYAVLFIGTLDLWLLLRWRESRPVFWRLAGAQALAALLYLPWIPALLAAATSGGNPFIRFAALKGFYTALVFSLGYSAVPIDSVAKRDLIGTFAAHGPKLALGGLAFGWLFVAGARDLWRRDRSLALLVLGWVGLPVVAATVVSLLFIPAISERYFFPALPLFALVLACGIAASRGPGRWLPAAAMAALTAQSLVAYYTDPAYGHHDWRAASAYVQDNRRPGDVVAVHPNFIRDPFVFYSEASEEPLVADHPDGARRLPAAPRLWLVVSHPRAEEPAVRAALEERWTLVEHRHLARGEGIDIYLYSGGPS